MSAHASPALLPVGTLANADYIAGIRGDVATLQGVVIGARILTIAGIANGEPVAYHSVIGTDAYGGAASTSSSSMPVRIIAPAGSPEAVKAARALLDSGRRFSDRTRAALIASLTPDTDA